MGIISLHDGSRFALKSTAFSSTGNPAFSSFQMLQNMAEYFPRSLSRRKRLNRLVYRRGASTAIVLDLEVQKNKQKECWTNLTERERERESDRTDPIELKCILVSRPSQYQTSEGQGERRK